MTALWSYGPLFFCFLFLILHQSLVGNLANLTGQQPQKALPIPTHVCSNCVQTAWLPVLGISNACTDNDDVVAQAGCRDTIRESALKVEKSLATVGSWGQRSGHTSRERQWRHTSVAPSRRLEWSSRDSGYTHKCCPLKEAEVDTQRETVATHKCCPPRRLK